VGLRVGGVPAPGQADHSCAAFVGVVGSGDMVNGIYFRRLRMEPPTTDVHVNPADETIRQILRRLDDWSAKQPAGYRGCPVPDPTRPPTRHAAHLAS
jgi:hypothetical protein